MQLIAWIDQNGNCYVGQAGRDDEWVKSEQNGGCLVRNENYGEIVSVEDIDRAFAEHVPQGTSTFLAGQDVHDFVYQE